MTKEARLFIDVLALLIRGGAMLLGIDLPEFNGSLDGSYGPTIGPLTDRTIADVGSAGPFQGQAENFLYAVRPPRT